VIVSGVEQDSIAAMAGIQPGTLIQEVNRQAVNNTQQFQEAIANTPEGRPILLRVLDGQFSRYVTLRPS
jgi:serine protease Do